MPNESSTLIFCTWVADFLADHGEPGFWPCIVFADTKALAAELATAASTKLGYEVPVVTGDLAVKKREETAEDLRTGKLQLVISTPVWSQGIDIPGLATVVLTGQGSAPIKLIQQAGRGARPAKPSFNIVVLARPGHAEAVGQKVKRLVEEGYELGDTPFVRELLDHVPQEKGRKSAAIRNKGNNKSTDVLIEPSFLGESMVIMTGKWMPRWLKLTADLLIIAGVIASILAK